MNNDKLRRFGVKVVGSKRRITVVAGWYRIEDGVLTFRRPNLQGQYPIMVHAFARGAWLDIKNLDDNGSLPDATTASAAKRL